MKHLLKNGNDLTWSTDGKDIYYQGKTEKISRFR